MAQPMPPRHLPIQRRHLRLVQCPQSRNARLRLPNRDRRLPLQLCIRLRHGRRRGPVLLPEKRHVPLQQLLRPQVRLNRRVQDRLVRLPPPTSPRPIRPSSPPSPPSPSLIVAPARRSAPPPATALRVSRPVDAAALSL